MDPTSTGTPQAADPSLAGPPIALPTKAATFGALYIGLSISILLYGFSLHQTLRYYRSYPQDRIIIKIWVLFVMVVETLTTAFMFHTTYLYLVVGGASLIQLGEPSPWSGGMVPIMGILSVVGIQGFYARRIYHLGRQYIWVVVLAVLLCLAELGLGLSACILSFISPSVEKFDEFLWLFAVEYGLASFTDGLLTTVLILILLKGRSRDGFKSTQSMIDALIVYAINTGLIPAMFSILTFVFSLTNPHDLLYGSFSLIAAKLYSISFLTMLNSRKAIGRRAELVDDFESRPAGQHTPFHARTGSSGGSTNLQNSLVIAMPPPHSSGTVNVHVDGKDRYSTGDGDATELSTRVGKNHGW